MTTPADIDALLAAPKALAGTLAWREEGNTARLAAPVMVGDAIRGGLILHIQANIHTDPQRGVITLVFEGQQVARASFRPKGVHANSNSYPTPPDLRFMTLPADMSREYIWADNREWPRDRNRPMAARQMNPQPATLREAIDSFLAQCNITAVVPDAPWRPELFER